MTIPRDLRTLTVADLMAAITRGEFWAWQIARNVVASAAAVARVQRGRRDTPVPGPRVPA